MYEPTRYEPAGGPSGRPGVGAILLFFGEALWSSFSDSLVSRLPRTLPLTELAVLITPDMGVCGGVVQGKLAKDVLAAAMLGTFPNVGVGLLLMTPAGVCAWDDWVTMEDVEFDLVGLGG